MANTEKSYLKQYKFMPIITILAISAQVSSFNVNYKRMKKWREKEEKNRIFFFLINEERKRKMKEEKKENK